MVIREVDLGILNRPETEPFLWIPKFQMKD